MMTQSVDRGQSVEMEMPQHHPAHPAPSCRHRLITVLFSWVSILTIGQMLSITLFFIQARHPETSMTSKPGQMILIGAEGTVDSKSSTTGDSEMIQWTTQQLKNSPVSIHKENLTVNEDGTYFLYVQVSLSRHTKEVDHTVRVKRNGNVILESNVPNSTLTTGFLGKGLFLSTYDTLVVTISPKGLLNCNHYVTYMGIYQLPSLDNLSTQAMSIHSRS